MSANIKTINSSSVDNNHIFRDWHENQKKRRHSFFHRLKNVSPQKRYLLIGAPNVGKSTFFNKITTSTAMVSNIDRMTNDDIVGRFKDNPTNYLIDLPGIYNLSHPIDEETIVAHEIFHEQFNKVINVIAASSIRRDLFLTIQLIESGKLSTLAINMIDELPKNSINVKKLKQYLNGVDIVLTQANRNKSVNKVERSVLNKKPIDSSLKIYPEHIEKLINEIAIHIPNRTISQRYYALMFLENNQFMMNAFKKYYSNAYKKITNILQNKNLTKISQEIIDARNQYIEQIMMNCVKPQIKNKFTTNFKSRKVDRCLLKKWVGIPAFILLMFIVYYVSFGPWTGGYIQDRLDYVLNTLFVQNVLNDKLFNIGSGSGVSNWFATMFTNGLLTGFFTVLTFIPILVILFLCVNLMQQIGILSRVSVLLDETLEKFGVSGRSVVNLLTGFGCTVPAVMMARNSNSKKERIISTLIVPFTICSARAIVLSFVSNAIFGSQWGWLGLIGFIVISGLLTLVMGLLFSKTMFRNSKSFFIIEMVKWRVPDFAVIIKVIWLQIKKFWKEAVLIITFANLFIWLLLHIEPTHRFIINDDQNIGNSLLASLSKGINYIMYPAGFYSDNDSWKLTASLLSAFPAKEIALTNLNLLFPNNSVSSFFGSHIALGLSYLTMIMFYTPCSATVAVMHKETNWKLTFTHIGIALCVSYILAILVYWLSFAILTI